MAYRIGRETKSSKSAMPRHRKAGKRGPCHTKESLLSVSSAIRKPRRLPIASKWVGLPSICGKDDRSLLFLFSLCPVEIFEPVILEPDEILVRSKPACGVIDCIEQIHRVIF